MKFEDVNKLFRFFSGVMYRALSFGTAFTPHQLGLSVIIEILIMD